MKRNDPGLTEEELQKEVARVAKIFANTKQSDAQMDRVEFERFCMERETEEYEARQERPWQV